MKLVGLTGGIACGKSTVAAMLRELGVKIINADDLARVLVLPGKEAWKEIVAAFGTEILAPDKTIDREKLRKIIFEDAAARARLDAITHPRIRALAQLRAQELAAKGAENIIYEAPLLFENNAHSWLRPVIVVACDPGMQRRRLKARDRLSDAQIDQHLQAQMPLDEKRALADYVIENNGDLDDTKRAVREVWGKIVNDKQTAARS
ncbi:MAG TPA: dephospho-CoA kinase [Candidatus Binatia bacterium]